METRRKKTKPLPTYRAHLHSDEAINAAIRRAIPMQGVFWDYLTEERLVENFGMSEFERGVIEGARRFAARLQDIALSEDLENRENEHVTG